MNAIQPVQPALLPSPGEFQTMLQMAETLITGGLLPQSIKSAQAAFTIVQKGRELGVPPMAALNGIHVINGKPTCAAELMAALIYRDHGDNALDFVQTDNHICTIAYRRRGWPQARRYSFSLEDAQQAGLSSGPNSGNWKRYPAAMLRARCISAVARFAFPDTIGGMYTPEELGAVVDADGHVVGLVEADTEEHDVAGEAHFRATVPALQPSETLVTREQFNALKAHAEKKSVPWDVVHAQALSAYDLETIDQMTEAQGRDLAVWINHKSRILREAQAAAAAAPQEQPAEPEQPTAAYTTDAEFEVFDDFDEADER